MPVIRNAVIVGGGTAGLSTAIAFRRAGIDAEVVEIKPDTTVLGSGVTIMGAMYRALAGLGLADECARLGSGGNEISIYDAAGTLLQTVSAAQVAGPNYPGIGGIMRSTLQKILLEAAAAQSTPLTINRSVRALTQSADGVEVEFSDGQRDRYDLVVGADGLHSQIRRLVFGPEIAPHYTGQAVWRAVVSRPPGYSQLAMVYGPKGKAGINAVSATQAYLFIAENITDTARPPREQWPARIRNLLADFGGPVAAMGEQITDPSTTDYRALQALIVPAPWHRGRVVLVGDAAHGPLPQLAMGAGLAVEDALVLTEVLGSEQSLEVALKAYTDRRFERCKAVVEQSVQLGEWEQHPDAPDADPAGLSERSWAALAEPI